MVARLFARYESIRTMFKIHCEFKPGLLTGKHTSYEHTSLDSFALNRHDHIQHAFGRNGTENQNGGHPKTFQTGMGKTVKKNYC